MPKAGGLKKASNTLKNVAKEASQKVARAKRASDEIYNARRRAKRKLERELKKEKPNENLVSSLRERISQSYATKSGEYLIDINRFKQESYTYKRSYEKRGETDINRKNELFQREINQASVGGVSKFTKEETKIFYAATQKIWQGKPQGMWNKAIMDYFGVSSLEDAWNLVFENDEVKKALKQAKLNQKPVSSDKEIAQGQNDEREEKGSPPYIKGLILAMDM